MDNNNFNLLFVLVKLKFYILGLLDSPDKNPTFYLTEEFLERRAPEHKSEIISALKKYGINSDSEIAFDDSVVLKFREMVKKSQGHKDISEILSNFEIESKALQSSLSDEYRSEREKYLHSILDNLFQLSSNWVMLKEIENKFEDYSVLDEEDVIRPEEEEKLNVLNSNTSTSFKIITLLTTNYTGLLAEYYFNYGGDIELKEFWNNLDKIKSDIEIKYKNLFRKSGLDDESTE
jgi:hypothetical protein